MTIHNHLLPASSSEGDFFALLKEVWAKKTTLGVSAVLVGVCAAFYAFLSIPVYYASAELRPAAINELDALNRTQLYNLSPLEALMKTADALNSYEVRLGFFQKNPALAAAFDKPDLTFEQSFQQFNREALRLTLPDPKKNNSLTAAIGLELTYEKGVDGVTIVNGLIDYAIAQEREKISADMDVIINNRIRELDNKITAARALYAIEKTSKIALLLEADSIKRAQLEDELKALRVELKTRRTNRIAELSEAIQIATSLGIKRPTTPSLLGDAEGGKAVNVVHTEVTNQQAPLYFLGTDALLAEKAALLRRVSDDFSEPRIAQINRSLQLLRANREVEVLKARTDEDNFLKDTGAMHKEMVRLKNLDVDLARLQLASIDRQAVEPSGPIKPKRLLIIASGILGGLLIGVIFVLLRFLVAPRHHLVVEAQPLIDTLDQPGKAAVALSSRV